MKIWELISTPWPPHNSIGSWLYSSVTTEQQACQSMVSVRLYPERLRAAAITIDLSDTQFQQLQNLAKLNGVSVEVLLKASLEDWLNPQNSDFVNATDYVLTKNAELYRRLA